MGDLVATAGYGHRTRGVERRNLGTAPDLGEKLARRLESQRQRRHTPGPSGSLLTAAASDDDARCIGERQRASSPGGGDFADAVPEVTFSNDAGRPQGLTMPTWIANSNGWATSARATSLCVNAAVDPLDDRPAKIGTQNSVDLLDGCAKSRVGAKWRAPHAGELGAIARKHKGQPRPVGADAGD